MLNGPPTPRRMQIDGATANGASEFPQRATTRAMGGTLACPSAPVETTRSWPIPDFWITTPKSAPLNPSCKNVSKPFGRNAIHMVPIQVVDVHVQYALRPKTPISSLIDGAAAVLHGRLWLFHSPNGGILRDGDAQGGIPPVFCAAVYAYEYLSSFPALAWLDLKGPNQGIHTIPYYPGHHWRHPDALPGDEYVVQDPNDRARITSLYGLDSLALYPLFSGPSPRTYCKSPTKPKPDWSHVRS